MEGGREPELVPLAVDSGSGVRREIVAVAKPFRPRLALLEILFEPWFSPSPTADRLLASNQAFKAFSVSFARLTPTSAHRLPSAFHSPSRSSPRKTAQPSKTRCFSAGNLTKMVSTSLSKTPHVDRSRNSRFGGISISLAGSVGAPDAIAVHIDLTTGLEGIRRRRDVRDGDSARECKRTETHASSRKNTIGWAKPSF